ncbi:MAG TPA: PAS domain-containing protein, partial [Oculatellaceae cyanobacterium]
MSAKILVVDDELPLQRLITQRFRRHIKDKQFDFVFAYNGREALEKLKADPSIDIVLVDINMPEMDGLTFLEHLKDIDQTIKAVVVSAYEDMTNIRAAMNRGAFDFITKPINFQDLEITINKTLDQVRQIKEKQHKLQETQNQLLKVNEALRESEQRLQAILDNSPTAVYLKDLQGRYILINQQTARNTRCSTEEVIGKTDHELLPQEIANQLWTHDREVLNTLTALVIEEVLLMEDGLHTYISVKFPLFDAQGSPYAVCGISTDITDRKNAEEALKKLNEELEERVKERTKTLYRREQEFKALVENTPDVIARYDKQLRHLYINPVIEQEMGIPSSAFIGQTLSEVGFPESLVLFWEKHLREVLTTGEAKLMEFNFNGSNGLQFYEARVVPEKSQDESITSVLSIARNITVRKLAEEEIFKALQREKELLELKSSFVAMTSHEFRTPLTTIQSSVELLERYGNQWSPEKQQTHLQRISTSVRRMTQMLDDILIISEAEAGKLKFNPAPMDLVKFCRTLVEELK